MAIILTRHLPFTLPHPKSVAKNCYTDFTFAITLSGINT